LCLEADEITTANDEPDTAAPRKRAAPKTPASEKPDTPPRDEGPVINAPLSGTFYTSPGPDKEVFVTPGDEVTVGKTVCIVEAMKLFNEIKAPCNCRIVQFLAAHGDTVQKEQPLVKIEEI
jgi:biotin carboxyl carrier protein